MPVTAEACACGTSSVAQTSGADGPREVIRVKAIALSSPPVTTRRSLDESGISLRHLVLFWWMRWRVVHLNCSSASLTD